MKVLALMGTPRRTGNGAGLVAELERALQRLGQVSLDSQFLGDLGLPFCRGCSACITRGEQLCPHKAITLPFRERLGEYDAFIFYSPVYAHGVSAITKNFIDHFAYLFHRPRMVDRPALALVTTDGSGIRETLAYLRLTAVGFGCHYVGGLGAAALLMQLDPRYRQHTLKRVERLAGHLYRAAAMDKRRAPGLYELVFFRAMRNKARFIKVDHEYWQAHGWLGQSYFVKRPLNPIANAAAATTESMSRWYLQRYARKLGYGTMHELQRALESRQGCTSDPSSADRTP